MPIEVCGSQKYDPATTETAPTKTTNTHVIFVHAYKHHKNWKKYLIKRIMAIEEQRHDQVMKMLQHSSSKERVKSLLRTSTQKKGD
jgi:hypothetical protein